MENEHECARCGAYFCPPHTIIHCAENSEYITAVFTTVEQALDSLLENCPKKVKE